MTLMLSYPGIPIFNGMLSYENAIIAARKTKIYKCGSNFMEACLFGLSLSILKIVFQNKQRIERQIEQPVVKAQIR